jgi:hypothetical protein
MSIPTEAPLTPPSCSALYHGLVAHEGVMTDHRRPQQRQMFSFAQAGRLSRSYLQPQGSIQLLQHQQSPDKHSKPQGSVNQRDSQNASWTYRHESGQEVRQNEQDHSAVQGPLPAINIATPSSDDLRRPLLISSSTVWQSEVVTQTIVFEAATHCT